MWLKQIVLEIPFLEIIHIGLEAHKLLSWKPINVRYHFGTSFIKTKNTLHDKIYLI